MELAQAYATLVRGGVYRPAGFVTDDPPSSSSMHTPLLLRDACFAALAAIAEPSRTAHVCPEAARSNVAWKTGTSSGHRDAWCAAVTHRLTVVSWLGNVTGRGSEALVGADAAAPAALGLIAALDPVDESWPTMEMRGSPLRSAARFAKSPSVASAVSIVSPPDGAELIVTGEAQHKIELRAGASSRTGDSTAWWFVDGTSIGSGGVIDWWPTPGCHEVRLVDDAGHSAVARVRIR